MEHWSTSSPSRLPYVDSYTGYHEDVPVRRLEEPPAQAILILGFGSPMDVVDASGRRRTHRAFAVGLEQRPSTTEHFGGQLGVEVRLSPLAARRLLRVPMSELADGVIELDDLVGPDAEQLLERLAGAPSWDARFALVDSAIARALDGTPPPRPEVAWAWRRLCASGGRARVDDLAHEAGWSRRHLAACFRDEVGLAPKAAARLLRFNRAATLLRRGAADRLGDVALDCGYFDQAHLNRDFREFAGCTPGQFTARVMPGGAGVAA